MNASDGFFLGIAVAAAVGALVLSLAHKLATRVHAARERRRMDQQVRLAFAKLAGQMATADKVLRVKQDMPWPDRLKEAQAGQIVNLGITVRKSSAVA